MSSSFRDSDLLDQYAREAGIAIQRYQNPLDIERSNISAAPLIGPTSQSVDDTTALAPTQPQTATTATSTKTTTTTKKRKQRVVVEAPTVVSREEATTSTKSQSDEPLSITSPTKPAAAAPTPASHIAKLLDSSPSNNTLHALPSFRQQELIAKTSNTKESTKESIRRGDDNENFSDLDDADDDDMDGQYSEDERKTKAAEIFKVIETKLAPNLKRVQQQQESVARELHELEQLESTIKLLQLAKKSGSRKTIEAQVDLGCKVFAQAKFLNSGSIVIHVGMSLFVEMTYEEALPFIRDRYTHLHDKLQQLEDDCCLWSARVKSMHEAIGVLMKITDAPEQQPLQRDIWAN